jgi:hypothetical protein
MTEDKAKNDLRKMLRSFTAGGILHLLARVYYEDASKAQGDGKQPLCEDLMTVGNALTVAGYGVDVVCPHNNTLPPLAARGGE